VGIDTLAVNSPCSPCIVQSSYTTKQMHEFIFSGISSQHYKIFDRKIFKQNSKAGFQNRKPADFGFQTENRISGFRLTSLILIHIVHLHIPANICVYA